MLKRLSPLLHNKQRFLDIYLNQNWLTTRCIGKNNFSIRRDNARLHCVVFSLIIFYVGVWPFSCVLTIYLWCATPYSSQRRLITICVERLNLVVHRFRYLGQFLSNQYLEKVPKLENVCVHGCNHHHRQDESQVELYQIPIARFAQRYGRNKTSPPVGGLRLHLLVEFCFQVLCIRTRC